MLDEMVHALLLCSYCIHDGREPILYSKYFGVWSSVEDRLRILGIRICRQARSFFIRQRTSPDCHDLVRTYCQLGSISGSESFWYGYLRSACFHCSLCSWADLCPGAALSDRRVFSRNQLLRCDDN